ncbi:P-loop containing nucleoside triphosphate hydrolase protein [Haematococcus lacustris]
MPVLKSNADELVALPGALGARLDAGMHGPPQHHAAGQGNMPSNAGAGADGRQGPGGQQQQQPVSDKGGVPKEEEEGGGAEAGKPGKGRKRKAGSEEEGDEEEEEEGSGDENEEDGEEGASEARRAWDPSHAARMAHNKAMRNEAHERDAIRALFLKTHLDKLKMFVTEEVVETIEKESAAAPTDYAIPEPVQEQPSSIRGEMREYQVAGLQWLVRQYDHGINAILADEMGLGKTLQTIAFLAYLTFDRHVTGPHLVVVPLSVLPNWMAEFKRFAPDLRVVRIHVNDEGERQRLRREVLSDPSSFDVAVTTYDMVNSVHFGETLKHAIVWRYVVLDEGHRVKNEDALISQGMRQVQKQHVLMLTGTPVQNNLHELFALLNFMFPDVFTSSEAFDKAFNLTQNVVDTGTLEAAHYLLRPFMLRRVKDEVECKLPPKVETRINCPLSEFQTFWYRRLLLRDCEMLKQVESEAAARGMPGANPGAGGSNGGAAQGDEDTAPVQKKGRWANKQNEDGVPFTSAGPGSVSHWNKMMNLLMQLRKVCNHPYLFNIDAEPNFDGVTTGEDIVEASGKMQVLDRMLQKLKQKGHRVVLFSQFSRMLDILEDYIHLRGWKYKRLDGSTNRIQRMIDIQQFNKPNSDVFMYILCTRAGGLGVNLQTADTCILFDSDWNPQQDLQAMARVHRIGQTKPVHVYRLVSEGTVEERIQRRAEGKLYLDQMVNRGSTQGAEEMEKMNKHEVLSMLKYGADRIFKNDAGRSPTDSELDSIIDRSNMMATTATGDVKLEDPVAQAAAAAAVKPDPTSQDAAAGAVKSEADMFTTGKHSANDFNVDAPTISTFEFAGIDYKEIKMQAQNSSLKDLARMFWEERKDRLLKVEGDTDKQQQQHQGSSRPALPPPKEGYGRRRRQTAGEDYLHCDFCQRCWDGGNLLCCDFCPVAVHPHCLGLAEDEVKAIRKWGCPHHSCATCGRNTAASGGLLFRCEVCDNAFCEDHVPEGYEIMGECEHMQALGQIHPKQACFILCSANCQ